MKYEVRYILGHDEHTAEIDADNAASAAQQVQDQHLSDEQSFELIQVHLLEDQSGDESETAP